MSVRRSRFGSTDAQRALVLADRLPVDASEYGCQMDRVYAGFACQGRRVVTPVGFVVQFLHDPKQPGGLGRCRPFGVA
jgi:hypothetical protein